jgi:hypothetical protein
VTGEPIQPARIYFDLRDKATVLAVFQDLRCVRPDPARRRWVWLFEEEVQHLPFVVRHQALPERVHPVVLGSLRFPDKRQLVLHTLSFDRAIYGVRFLAPRLARAAGLARARVLNRWVDDADPQDSDALDALLDHDATIIDPEAVARAIEAAVDKAGARGDPGKALEVMQAFDRLHDVPMVEDFPLYPEEETWDYADLAATLHLRSVRAARHWEGQTDVSLADIIREAARAMSRDRGPSRPDRKR